MGFNAVQSAAHFITEQRHRMQTLLLRRLHVGEHVRHAVRIIAMQRRVIAGVQARTRFVRACAGVTVAVAVVEQGEAGERHSRA